MSECSECGRGVSLSDPGVWAGDGGKLMCARCGRAKVKPAETRFWNPETGGFESFPDGPFAGINFETDETIPPDHMVVLGGGEARCFRLDVERETGVEVSRWPQKDAKR